MMNSGKINSTEEMKKGFDTAFIDGSLASDPVFRTQFLSNDHTEGIKVLRPKDPKASLSLPERSNTPGTSYVLYGREGTFKQFITFDENRLPLYRIDYGTHQGKKSLHVHYFKNGNKVGQPDFLHPGDKLYEKHKRLFKGVK